MAGTATVVTTKAILTLAALWAVTALKARGRRRTFEAATFWTGCAVLETVATTVIEAITTAVVALLKTRCAVVTVYAWAVVATTVSATKTTFTKAWLAAIAVAIAAATKAALAATKTAASRTTAAVTTATTAWPLAARREALCRLQSRNHFRLELLLGVGFNVKHTATVAELRKRDGQTRAAARPVRPMRWV